MKIIADDKIPFLKGVLEPYAEIIYLPGKEITHDVLIDADALLIRTRTKCNDGLLRGTNVRFIGTATIGIDHIDTQFCERNNIRWINAPGCNSSSVQQYIASALISIARHGKFHLDEKTIGIIGAGNVGSKVARLAEILGMRVLLNDPPRARREGEAAFVKLDRILMEADIITLHIPLTVAGEDQTFHLFDSCTFNKLKQGTWLINSSRGEVVDTDSLQHELEISRLGGAVIDVWENEPDIDLQLLSTVFIATPHIAGYSTDGKANGTAMVVDALCRYFGLPVETWYPENLPRPVEPDIFIDGTSESDEEILSKIILHTYNIKADDAKFRNSPSDFEKQRGNYPVRREFSSFNVNPGNASEKIRLVSEKLGFNIFG